ncbi:MAG: PD-(D/E)XK nuclease family protein [Bacteroidota bacterium]
MSPVEILPSSENIIEEIASRLSAGSADLSAALVVFPGKRPAHFLRKALAARIGSPFVPPEIHAYEGFAELLFTEKLGLHKPLLAPLDAVALLHEIHLALPEKLGGDHFKEFDAFVPLGFRVFEEMEGLLLAGITDRDLSEKVGGLTFQRLHTLVRYYREFYRMVESRGFSTRATRMKAIAEKIDSIDLSEYKQILFAGFYALTKVERTILKSLAGREQTTLLFQQGPGLRQHLEQLDISAEPPIDSEDAPRIFFYQAADSQGQVSALAGRINDLLKEKGRFDEHTAIVLPAPQALFPVLHQVLALLPEEEYNISLGYPLSRTPLYGFLTNLLTVAASAHDGAVSAPAYMNLVLHPYTKNIRFKNRSEVTRVLFHSLEDSFARRKHSGVLRIEDVENDEGLFKRAAASLPGVTEPELRAHVRWIHDQTVRKFGTHSSLKEFAEKIIELILFIQDHSTAGFHPLFRSYAEKLLELCDTIKNSLAGTKTLSDPASFESFLRNTIAGETVPFPGTPVRGLQVLGLLETRNLSFERVFVLDANDDILPGAKGVDALIPQGLREQLGIETYRDRDKLIEYYLHLLMGGAKEVHFFFTESGEKEKSRFLERMLWEQEKRNPEAKNPVRRVHYNIHLVNKDPAAVAKSPELMNALKEFEYSATSLDTYLKCQLQFYYRYVLNLREKEEVVGEPRQLDVGNLVHKALRRFYEPLVGRQLTKELIDPGAMEKAVRFVFEEEYGQKLTGSVYLVERQVRAKLLEFLKNYQLPLLEKQEVHLLNVEQEISMNRNGRHFTGRIDRIERRGSKVIVLDYKIRHDDAPYKVQWSKFNIEDRGTWSESIGSLQLPMYAMLYAQQSGVSSAEIEPAYVALGKNYLDARLESGLGRDDVAESNVILEKVILNLVEEIEDGGVSFEPTDDKEEQCPRCPYKVICGTQWTRERGWGS